MPEEFIEEEDEFPIPNVNQEAFRRFRENARIEFIQRMEVNRNEEQIRVVNNAPIPRVINIPQVLDTIGIELESLALSRDSASRILNALPVGLGRFFKVHRDGSSEINAYYLNVNRRVGNYITISAHTKVAEELFEGKQNKNTIGYELISIPMDINTSELVLNSLLPALRVNGDFTSERCATHIHVGGVKNLGFLKNALKLGLWFDEVFYSLAHLDSERFRGHSNNAIYARPLINGPFFKYDRNYYQVLNWAAALDASDLYEFYTCYGANIEGELNKYHPGRYFSINLYSIPRIGTVEFRHFNQSFNPQMIHSVAKLCQLFVEVAIRAKYSLLEELEPADVFTLQSPSYYYNKLYRFLSLAEQLECEYSLDKSDILVLKSIINRYTGIGVENREVLTHCKDFEIPYEIINSGQLTKSKGKPIPDGHTDIHNIKYQSLITKE